MNIFIGCLYLAITYYVNSMMKQTSCLPARRKVGELQNEFYAKEATPTFPTGMGRHHSLLQLDMRILTWWNNS
jgi:hypothetical protein